MTNTGRPSLKVARGLRGALAGAVGNFGLVVLLWAAFQRGEFKMADLGNDLLFPIVVATACGAGAGWATAAPGRDYRFATSLTIVTIGTFLIWATAWHTDIYPRRYRGNHPTIYPMEVVLAVGGPLLIGVALSLLRVRIPVTGSGPRNASDL